MGFKSGTYAKVWSVEPSENGKSTKMRISISKKIPNTDTYETDFSGYVSCIGDANTAARNGLKSGDRIKLEEVDVGNSYNKETKATTYYFRIYKYSSADGGNSSNYPFTSQPVIDTVKEISDDDAPF